MSAGPAPAATLAPRFDPVEGCWICGGDRLAPIHECLFELSQYRAQDPELAAYTGTRVQIRRCRACGFAQPAAVPSLPRFFERLYDQRWSDEWIAEEFESDAKTLIFSGILDELQRRLPAGRRTLLDVGAHAGRFLHLARSRGWQIEGVELNRRTAAYAARETGAPIHRMDLRQLAGDGCRFDALTLTDVLEHIADPVGVLKTARSLLLPGGWIAVKVPCGPAQLRKERVRAVLGPGRRVSVADNLVHINHFSRGSLRLAIERAGFGDVTLHVGVPELPASSAGPRARVARAARLAVYRLAGLTGGVRSPLAFNLQAFARRRDS